MTDREAFEAWYDSDVRAFDPHGSSAYDIARTTWQAALASERAKQAELVASMKRDLEKFRDVDNTECGRNWFISRVAWHLDRAAPPAVQQASTAATETALWSSDIHEQ